MIVKAITIPTPKRVRNSLKKYATKERVAIYSLIGTGIAIISLNSIPIKAVPIGALVYCGIAYEVIDNMVYETEDEELIKFLLENNFYYRSFGYLNSFL
ncbi:MAG: hypothetical protein ACRDD2_02555 [Sarcina sp.]